MQKTIVAILLVSWVTARGQEQRAVAPVVAVATVEEGKLERAVRQAVTLYPYEQVMVYAKVTGYAEEVRADIGDEVAASGEPGAGSSGVGIASASQSAISTASKTTRTSTRSRTSRATSTSAQADR